MSFLGLWCFVVLCRFGLEFESMEASAINERMGEKRIGVLSSPPCLSLWVTGGCLPLCLRLLQSQAGFCKESSAGPGSCPFPQLCRPELVNGSHYCWLWGVSLSASNTFVHLSWIMPFAWAILITCLDPWEVCCYCLLVRNRLGEAWLLRRLLLPVF